MMLSIIETITHLIFVLSLMVPCDAFMIVPHQTIQNNINQITSQSHIRHHIGSIQHYGRIFNLAPSNDEEDYENDDDDDDDDYISDDELQSRNPSKLDFTNNPNPISFGPGRGRSAPTQRKAMGKSGSGDATVHVCTNCGAEYVNWMGKCSTCGEWNTIQEFKVGRESSMKKKPVFGSSSSSSIGGGGGDSNNFSSRNFGDGSGSRPSSWLSGIHTNMYNEPVRITDVYKEMGYKDGKFNEDDNKIGSFDNRLQIPDDEELNNVLGGGIMPGSLTLLGGDPGVGQ